MTKNDTANTQSQQVKTIQLINELLVGKRVSPSNIHNILLNVESCGTHSLDWLVDMQKSWYFPAENRWQVNKINHNYANFWFVWSRNCITYPPVWPLEMLERSWMIQQNLDDLVQPKASILLTSVGLRNRKGITKYQPVLLFPLTIPLR